MANNIFQELAEVIEAKKNISPETSYVASLFDKGENSILKKIGEEATEVVLAAKQGDKEQIIYETADLWFHCLIMLSLYNLKPEDVFAELERRQGISGLDEKAARKRRLGS
jgi:phosphoribosyl-ATP pyrophosphohydrolase